MPELVYLLKDDNVLNLVRLVITGGEEARYHKISVKIRNSSARKYLGYEIVF